VVIGEGHRGLVAGEATGVHVEYAEAPRISGVGVGDRGPRRVFGLGVGSADVDRLGRFARGALLVHVVMALSAAGADHQVDEALVGINAVQVGTDDVRPQDGSGVDAVDHVLALV